MKSSRISRVVQILTTLQAGKSFAAVFRDLKELRAIGIPYRYNTETGGYTIEPEFFLPPIDLNLHEALSLLLLVHKASNQMQLPFKNSTLLAALKIENNLPVLAALKIENNLPDKVKQYCNTALQNVSVRLGAQAPAKSLDTTFAQLERAIARKHKVNISYSSFFEGEVIKLDLNPYHLLYNDRTWYVLGYSSLHESVRSFKLNRIIELKITERCFLGGENFDLYDYFGRAWSMIPEGRIYNVKLRFLPKVADSVVEVKWHSTQEVTRHSDGSATVEFRVDGLNEITWWILGYGDQVQVMAPKALRKKLLEAAKKMVKLNEQI
ncbi:MAG: helix-turn-helix transcriptional regulator [Planctomycetota bacterium]|jgi:proteasome accessory factor B